MIGEYLRVTPSQLDQAVKDPEWALDLAETIRDSQDESKPTPAEALHFSTYKTWDLLAFLLRRSSFPVDIIHGEECFAEDEDWGYGPPRYLPVERVRLAAEILQQTTYDQLIRTVTPSEIADADIYPKSANSADSLEWGRDYFIPLTAFFQGAAAAGHAVLAWLD
ncbi:MULTISPECIES: DUF1877 family protein [unclassified Pseudofrankia]|uniref:DUF1877 family protein n=1 Tax=unclassified Pseudofrankia TaxID=2994372 RepID=UPI0009F5AB51|nr:MULTISPECIES: DUF1877 family protein [unclassified Pseudofrankia]MDT3440645.1 DUF1877 family protein [Pseudofrankia sp. BMG5.37]